MTGDATDGARARRWALWTDTSELFDGPEDPAWAADRDQLADDVHDPWSAGNGTLSGRTDS